MFQQRLLAVVGSLLLVVTWSVCAEDASKPESEASTLQEILYKGIAGKALDLVPMDPGERLALQQTNTVVSNTLSVRSLAVWAGFTNPILLLGGLVWGLFSASQIKPATLTPSPIPPARESSTTEIEQTSSPIDVTAARSSTPE